MTGTKSIRTKGLDSREQVKAKDSTYKLQGLGEQKVTAKSDNKHNAELKFNTQ